MQSSNNVLRGSYPDSFPQRISFSVWTAAWGKILTCENLIKRGYYILSCYLICCSGKVLDHLLIHCSVALGLWSLLLDPLRCSGFYQRKSLSFCVDGGIGLVNIA